MNVLIQSWFHLRSQWYEINQILTMHVAVAYMVYDEYLSSYNSQGDICASGGMV